MNYFNFRLPYFYHLPITILLVVHVFYRVEAVLASAGPRLFFGITGWSGEPWLLYFRAGLSVLPAITAAVYFYKQFRSRNDLLVREGVLILILVQFLGHLLPSFLPYV